MTRAPGPKAVMEDYSLRLIRVLVNEIVKLKDGLDPEVISKWFRIIEAEARSKAPEEVRDKINVLQDPDLPMRFRLVVSKRAVPFVIDAIESNLPKMPFATRLYFQIVESMIWEEYRKSPRKEGR